MRDYNGWEHVFLPEFEKEYFKELKRFLLTQYKEKTIFPPANQIFTAFDLTSYGEVKVVILGQDPYPNEHQAMGLAFSVPPGQPVPASLYNIKKEIESDLGYKSQIPLGDLTPWARQGVLLLNTVLTVEAHVPNSHKCKGWEQFTDAVIASLNRRDSGIVFMLWGNNAQAKKKLITAPQHLVLTAAHPSPLSVHNGFFGCKHFSRANEFLQHQNKEINW